MCDCCRVAMQYPDLTKKTYSTGCEYCAARYMRDGGESDVSKWPVDFGAVNEARSTGELIDPELKRRKRQ